MLTHWAAPSILDDIDCKFRAIGFRKPGLVFHRFWHRAVADFVSVSELIELEKIGRDLMATIVSLTLVLINSELELPGRRHRAFPPCSVSLFRKWNAPFHYRLHTAAGVGGNLPRGVRGKSSPGRLRLEKWGQIHPLRSKRTVRSEVPPARGFSPVYSNWRAIPWRAKRSTERLCRRFRSVLTGKPACAASSNWS